MITTHDVDNQNCVARALYDNIAESPDELAFRKGDLLTVLEQNTGGIEGWWLCSLRGRQGICPGNRLKLLVGVYDSGETEFPLASLSKRRSWHVQPNMVLTPQKFGDVYLYPSGSDNQNRYDVPPNNQDVQQAYDVPRALSREGSESRLSSGRSKTPTSPLPCADQQGQCYDIPRPIAPHTGGHPLTPSSSASSLTTSLSSSNRSSLVSAPEYDIPKPRAVSVVQFYDIPAPNPKPKELPLELNSALESLNRLQEETSNAVQKLLSLVTPTWRRPEHLQLGALEIKLTALRLRTALHELSEFCEGSVGNAHRLADKNLATKLRPLSKALFDADKIVQDSCNDLDHFNWSVEILSRDDDDFNSDSLDRLVACARSLTEDVRRAASFLHGNAPLLFKKDGSFQEDYDYVNLESKDKVAAQNREISDSLPLELKKSFDAIVRDAEVLSLTNNNYNENDDRSLVSFYAGLAVTHTANLTRAIDAFLQTVEHNQPPKIFLGHGKFVVLSAHQLVRIGDTVARNITQTHLKSRIQERADALAEALSQIVLRTKRAAQHFPSVAAVQDMVDSVVDVSHMARDLKMSLVSAIQQ